MSLEAKLQKLIRKLAYAAAISGSLLIAPKAWPYHTVPEGESKNVSSITPKEERKICHRDLTLEIIDSYKRQYGDTQAAKDFDQNEIILAMAQGAIDEDNITRKDGMRFVQHFYNPSRADDEDGLKVPLFNDGSKDALTRAKDLWQEASSSYKENNKLEAYHALGRVEHLLEDMGVPEHVYLIYHGPRLEKVACRSEEHEHSKLYDIASEAFKRISHKIKLEDIDWDKCITAEISSPYEDYCSRTLLEGALTLRQKIRPGSLDELFVDMANASLEPTRNMRDVFSRNFSVGDKGNGRYVKEGGEVSEEDCKQVTEYLVPQVIGRGVHLLKLWNDAIKSGEEKESSKPARNDSYTSIEGVNLGDYVLLPEHNLYIAKKRIIFRTEWFKSHDWLHERGARMLTMREFVDFLRLLRTKNVQDGLDKMLPREEIKTIYNEITEVKDPLRGEWLDAFFVEIDKKLYVNYNHRFVNGRLVPKNSEILDNCFIEDGHDIDLEEDWIYSATSQGLPIYPRRTLRENLRCHKPKDNCVASFAVSYYHNKILILNCAENPRDYFGVREVREKNR